MNRTRKKTVSAAPSNETLARKIHDDISQKLTVLGLELAVLQATLPADDKLAPKINHLLQLHTEIGVSVREVMEALSAKTK